MRWVFVAQCLAQSSHSDWHCLKIGSIFEDRSFTRNWVDNWMEPGFLIAMFCWWAFINQGSGQKSNISSKISLVNSPFDGFDFSYYFDFWLVFDWFMMITMIISGLQEILMLTQILLQPVKTFLLLIYIIGGFLRRTTFLFVN